MDGREFWERIDRRPDGCWHWQGARSSAGYGNLRFDGGYELAHRLAYRLHIGPIPDDAVIDHLCRNRACCNPAHLEPVTQAVNTQRGLAAYGLRTTCRNGGHDITDEANVYVDPRGHRHCRECKREYDRRRR